MLFTPVAADLGQATSGKCAPTTLADDIRWSVERSQLCDMPYFHDWGVLTLNDKRTKPFRNANALSGQRTS